MIEPPRATYRLQLHSAFRLDDARAILPYLARLGVDTVYLSPVFAARPGSAHGYDVIDPTRVNPELGGETAFAGFTEAARAAGLRVLLDIVPNHMAAHERNRWWWDVLEHGRSSTYAHFFDIEWRSETLTIEDQLLLPLLGDHYARALDRGELIIGHQHDRLVLRYFERTLPLDPRSYGDVLGLASDVDHGAAGVALHDLGQAFAALPPHTAGGRDAGRARREQAAALRVRLNETLERPEARAALAAALGQINAVHGRARLDALIRRQAYLPAYWRAATDEMNYRRFFNIADLVGIRVEEPAVFEAVHERLLEWVRAGSVGGVRVDHIDGLARPTEYLRRLRAAVGPDCYITVEKILVGEEALPEEWPIAGTTGYDFLNLVNRVLVRGDALQRLEHAYRALVGATAPYASIEYDKQRQIIRQHFTGEVRWLERELSVLARASILARDVPARRLGDVIVDVTACLPVYRTYIEEQAVRERDREVIRVALEEARRRNRQLDGVALEFASQVLLRQWPSLAEPSLSAHAEAFLRRWQQFTGPVMAKGVEDTSLYVYNRLVALNEVGGDPGAVALDPSAFHVAMQRRRADWPATMNASSTHDTKRSEDVRARVQALADLAPEWERRLPQWHGWNAALKASVGEAPAPDPNEEILIYQTLLGIWPLAEHEMATLPDRMAEYLRKALREAKVHSSWLDPNEAYEVAVIDFARRIMDPSRESPFLADILGLQRTIARVGAMRSIAQLVLKLAAPGVPDFYQGQELWEFSLVDPDNRRPVDYTTRDAVLRRLGSAPLEPECVERLARGWQDGAIKLHVTRVCLAARQQFGRLFVGGDYLPLDVAGGLPDASGRTLGFARRAAGSWLVAVVQRDFRSSAAAHADTTLRPADADIVDLRVLLPAEAPAVMEDLLTGRVLRLPETSRGHAVPLREALALLPAALLLGSPAQS
ncbi:MAG: malto-oligosyltrehalose synthase [Longimicrobiales bacterium]